MENGNDKKTRNLIAVLRHITPEEVVGVCDILVEGGFSQIEITVNTPEYEASLTEIVGRYPYPVKIGAGTVLTEEELLRVREIGVSFIVSPHSDPFLIARTKTLGLLSFPGVFTPTEAFSALKAGADLLKLFPASWATPTAAKDLKAVLPPHTKIYAMGGVGPSNFAQYRRGGFDGFGVGNSLFRPGLSPEELRKNCREIIASYDQAWDNPSQGSG